jgi:hypothetical protein
MCNLIEECSIEIERSLSHAARKDDKTELIAVMFVDDMKSTQ